MTFLKRAGYISAILLAMISFQVAAKKEATLTFDEGKAHYIIEVIKHITWPNEDKLTHFNIVVLSKDQELSNALNKHTTQNIRDKKLTIEQVNLFHNINNSSEVIVVSEHNLSLVPDISKKFPQSLIISDGTADKQNLMVGLLAARNNIKLTINRENIVKQGFIISNGLLDFAGTKADLRDQLKDKEDQLIELNNSLATNQQALSQILNELTNQRQQLLTAQKQLSYAAEQLSTTQEQLHSLATSKEAIKQELLMQKSRLANQQKLINEKEIEQQSLQQKLHQLNSDIALNEAKLQQQISTLEEKNNIIKFKEDQINDQRKILYITAVIILIIILLIFFVLRINIQRKQTNIKLYELATTDGMTKLFNRRHFLELAQRELNQLHRSQSSGVVLMIDIDHFKYINDNHGHAAGDEAINNLADILRDKLRNYDIVGRVGGEEFAMLLPNTDIETAMQVAERIRIKAAELTTIYQDISIKFTVSIGLTVKIMDDSSINSMLHRADKALYQAKNSGRNKVVAL